MHVGPGGSGHSQMTWDCNQTVEGQVGVEFGKREKSQERRSAEGF